MQEPQESPGGQKPTTPTKFITTNGMQFVRSGKPYFFLGINFWSAMNLGSTGPGGDRERLTRELDRLRDLGIRNIRIMASSEGANSSPERMSPTLQTRPRIYDDQVFEGLDYALDEMRKRDMVAVLCLNNFWHWSGGMSQYLSWSGGRFSLSVAGLYEEFVGGFYLNAMARAAAADHVHAVVSRVNTISGIPYRDDPTIMSWELANEPREAGKPHAYRDWVRQTSKFIKSLDTNHLVTIGSEGVFGSPSAGADFDYGSMMKYIDYTTVHIWIENWNWYDPTAHEQTYIAARTKFFEYLATHLAITKSLGKPLVLEEFGIARDHRAYEPSASIAHRDQFFRDVFDEALRLMNNREPLAGCNPWAWGGEGRPKQPGKPWHASDPWTGDPPHEPQGWYSIYDQDTSTLDIMRTSAAQIQAAAAPPSVRDRP